jgi:acetyl esterase/lipase
LVSAAIALSAVVGASILLSAEQQQRSQIPALTAGDAHHEFQLLWPNGAPGARGDEADDKPKITLYRADPATASGAAIIVCPGGQYHDLVDDKEGTQVAEWLNSLGISAFVLQYRLGPRYRHPAPLEDAQRAVRTVRARAPEWGIDPARIGIMGFSAGGHLASTVATHFDAGQPASLDPIERVSSRPDFSVLIYPVISMMDPITHAGSRRNLLGDMPDPKLVAQLSNERQVTAETPPTFLFHTADDPIVVVENSLQFFTALIKARVRGSEIHVFAHGGHGAGLAPDDPALSQWPKLFALWSKNRGLIERSRN